MNDEINKIETDIDSEIALQVEKIERKAQNRAAEIARMAERNSAKAVEQITELLLKSLN